MEYLSWDAGGKREKSGRSRILVVLSSVNFFPKNNEPSMSQNLGFQVFKIYYRD